ncbi:MAG: hypothetical protein P4L67_02315 [Candidatus Pacebacteria bacterium]|nr:hypothetical protein [Candidatus Paceibacterota bacterium]
MRSLKILLVLVPLGMVLMPLAVSAATISPVTAPNIWGVPPGYWAPNGIVSCSGNYLSQPSNPCTGLGDLLQTFVNVIYLVMSIALFILAPILFLVGAIMLMMGGANPAMLTKGRQTMIGVVVGIVIVLCAYLIVSTVISVLHISGITEFSSS